MEGVVFIIKVTTCYFIIRDKLRVTENTYHIYMGHGRCNSRLKTKNEGSKRLGYSGLHGGRGFLETM